MGFKFTSKSYLKLQSLQLDVVRDRRSYTCACKNCIQDAELPSLNYLKNQTLYIYDYSSYSLLRLAQGLWKNLTFNENVPYRYRVLERDGTELIDIVTMRTLKNYSLTNVMLTMFLLRRALDAK